MRGPPVCTYSVGRRRLRPRARFVNPLATSTFAGRMPRMRAVHWFRNDLRLEDNTALAAACAHADELVPLFVLDPYLLGEPGEGGARERPYNRISPKRSHFLLESLAELTRALA